MNRCPWVPPPQPHYVKYHDGERGEAGRGPQARIAKHRLDGAQAGLTWWTILQRRENYYAAFDGFDPHKIIHYDDAKIAELLGNAGIIRNRLKIQSVIKNAHGYLKIEEETGSFSDFLWSFVGGQTIVHEFHTLKDYLAISPESEAASKALKKYGFTFVGPTIVYAFMQAVGIVNDHSMDCFRRHEVMK